MSSPNIKADDNLEPTKDAESNGLDGNGQVVPVLKVEDVEVNGEEEEGDKEVPKPTMSKIASMKRDLSFGRLQKMFSREPKSESQQDSSVNAAELEPSPAPEVSATDEKLIKAEEAMGEEVTSEEVKSEEAKGEDIESRVTGLKKSLMKMFARESESEGATETLAATATEKEGDEEKIEGKEATPAKMTSLKKRLSFKAMRSKFSKEKKEAGSVEDNNEEEKEMEGKENAKTESNEKEDDEEESEEKEESTVKTSSLKKRLSFKVMRSKFSKEKKGADAGEDNTEEKKESEEKDIEKKENKETEDEMEEDEINKEAEAPSLVKDNCFKAMKSKFSKEKKEADACEENNDLEKENARTEDVEKEEVDDDETKQKVEEPSLVKDNCFKAMKSKFSKEKKEVSASEENVEKKEGDVREEVAADETKQEVETPAHADAKVNLMSYTCRIKF